MTQATGLPSLQRYFADCLDAFAAEQTAALRAALVQIRDEVDHIGKDHAFGYCCEIAARALLAAPEGT
jgi:hypothetical protein